MASLVGLLGKKNGCKKSRKTVLLNSTKDTAGGKSYTLAKIQLEDRSRYTLPKILHDRGKIYTLAEIGTACRKSVLCQRNSWKKDLHSGRNTYWRKDLHSSKDTAGDLHSCRDPKQQLEKRLTL